MESFNGKHMKRKDKDWQHNFAVGTDGVRLHYVRMGNGNSKKILLLHGWPGFWFDWRYIIDPVSEFADVIAPDFRGFGDSDKPDVLPSEGYTPDVLANDMVLLMDQIGFNEVTVVAHDIGSTVAQLLARKYPERIKALILCNPPYPGIGQRRFEPQAQKEFWYQTLHNLDWAENLIGYNRDTVWMYLNHFYQHWLGNKQALTPDDFETIVDQYALPGAVKGSISYYRARASARQSEAVSDPEALRITTPTFVLWGESDPVIPSSWSDRLEEFFPNCKLKLLPGIGHFVPFEAPEEIIKVLES
jgi:pimeloyl-ACP methyl ester carboxylesterase